ncbi:unnamed protein product [Prunus armeniaca]
MPTDIIANILGRFTTRATGKVAVGMSGMAVENSTFESTRPKTAALVSRFYHQIPEYSKFKSDVGSQAIDREQIAIPPGPPQHFKQGNIIKPIKSDIKFQLRLLIYTLGTENWRQIHLAIPESVDDEIHLCSFLENKPLCLNGKLYWPSYQYRTSCILVFEVRSEMFTTIPLPELHGPCDNKWDFYPFYCKLIEMDGCLGLLGELRERREMIGLWILRNNAWEMLHDNYLKTSFVLPSNMRKILGTLPTTITTWLLRINYYPIKMRGYTNVCMLDLNSQTWQPAVAFLPNEMLAGILVFVLYLGMYRPLCLYHQSGNSATDSLSQCLRMLRTTETAMLPAMNMEGESLLLRPHKSTSQIDLISNHSRETTDTEKIKPIESERLGRYFLPLATGQVIGWHPCCGGNWSIENRDKRAPFASNMDKI